MKKFTLLSMLMFIALINMSLQSYSQNEAVDFADIVTVMEKSTAAGNLPASIDDGGNTRGAAFNGEYVFVASRKEGDHVYYWDVNTPDAAPQELSMTDVSGGTFTINDVAAIGNHVFVSNMSFADGNFKIYHWAGVDAEPTVLIDYAAIPTRLGDAISVVGDPDVAATIYASGYGSQDVYVWQMVNGALVSATPEVITFADWGNVNFARLTASNVDDSYSLLSGPLGVAVVDDLNNISLNIEQAFFPAWPMYAQAFEYEGGRYLSFIHVNGDPAENMLYVLDISEGADLLAAMTALSAGTFADAVVHTADIGSVANLNASVSNEVVIDPAGNLWLMGFAAGNGFIVQKLGDNEMLVETLPFVENFEGDADSLSTWLPEGWLNIDADGDNDTWFWSYFEDETYMLSYSWREEIIDGEPTEVPLTPDNYLITPAISLPQVAENEKIEVQLSVTISASTPEYREERYEVLVSNTDTALTSFTMVYEETFEQTDENWVWQDKNIDISEYAGDVVYIAVRHHGSTFLDAMGIQSFAVNVVEDVAPEPLIYSISIPLAPGQVQYKYFATMGEPNWGLGEWTGDPNRVITVQSDTLITDVWAVQPQVDTVAVDSEDVEYIVTFTVDMTDAMVTTADTSFAFNPDVHQVYIAGSFGGDLEWNEPGSNPDLEMTIGDTGVVSVPELEVDNVQLKIFPNPASTQFTVTAQSRISELQVSDITGRTIKTVKADDLQLNLDTSGMNNGIYIISVYTQEGVTVSKLQIQR